MTRNYDVHTELMDADEKALQKAHEGIGLVLEAGKVVDEPGDRWARLALEQSRELIGNVLASAEDAEEDNLTEHDPTDVMPDLDDLIREALASDPIKQLVDAANTAWDVLGTLITGDKTVPKDEVENAYSLLNAALDKDDDHGE